MRPRVLPSCHLMLTVPILPKSVVVPVLACQHISRCYDVLIVGYSCRKGLERQAGEMGGEVEH